MLRAITTNKQTEPHKQRLWFSDHDHDLFVWIDRYSHPVSFQLSYRVYSDTYSEHIISWKKETGYTHNKIDDGEHANGDYKKTPIMVPNGACDSEKLAERFKSISADVDEKITDFVYQKLCDYTSAQSNQ